MSPDWNSGDRGGREQVHIDESNASSHQRAIFDESQGFGVRCAWNCAEMAKQFHYPGSVPEIAASDLADDKWMHADQL